MSKTSTIASAEAIKPLGNGCLLLRGKQRLLIACFAIFASSPLLAQSSDPVAFLQSLFDELMVEVRENTKLREGDTEAAEIFVQEKLLPVVNLRRTTANAIGRPWRSATKEQRDRLQQEFMKLMIRTYVGSLKQVRADTTVVFLPFRGADTSKKTVVVQSRLEFPDREPISVSFRLEKNKDSWRLYDVALLGVWLAPTYRAEFNGIIQKHGIDGLIQALVEKNKMSVAAADSDDSS